MISRRILGLGLAVLFLTGSTFTFANLAGEDAISGILPSKAFASTQYGLDDLDIDDGVGPVGDASPASNGTTVSGATTNSANSNSATSDINSDSVSPSASPD